MNSDQITSRYRHDVDQPPAAVAWDRRDFLKNLGGGIIIVFSWSDLARGKGMQPKNKEEIPAFNAYLRVKEDGRVDCYSGKIEMGQGALTSLAQVLAEELAVNIDKIDMVMGDTELCPHDDGTWGSMTTRFHDPIIRAAAAEARLVLVELAAEKLKVAAGQLKADDGKVFDTSDKNKSISFSELTQGKKIIRTISEKPVLKKPAEFRVIGKSHHRLDSLKKVTGKALYSADIRLPAMLYARVVRPPAHGAKLVTCSTSAAESISGTRILKEDDFIVVLHASPQKAEQALDAVQAKWEMAPSKADDESIFAHILKTTTESKVSKQGGSLEAGQKESGHLFENEYQDGYKAHAPMETHAATAVFEKGKLTMWASSQTPFGTREEVAKKLGLAKEKVHLKQVFIGGGFGGKIYNQQALEAARIAKMAENTPIQLMWSRREEFMYDNFRSAAVIRIHSGITQDGKIKLWEFNSYCAGDRGTQLFYDIPNHKTSTFDGAGVHPFGTGAWRAPGNPTNTFARESQIDIMAHKVGMDPVEFRLKNMNNERAVKSLKLAAEKFGWSSSRPPRGTGRGVATGIDAGTLVTVIAEVQVDPKTGAVKVKRVVVGQDMGQVVNPTGTIIQAEGCVNMGLGYALFEDVRFQWGEVKSSNFNDYQITQFSTIPDSIQTELVDAMDKPPQGGGEPAIICMGAAIANAVFEACGARVFRLPITPARVLQALKV